MSISYEYLGLLDTLSYRNESLDYWWNELYTSYVSGNSAMVTHALFALAECALTQVAAHMTEHDKICAKRSIEWWYGNLIGEMHQLHRNKNAGYSGRNTDPWHNFRVCNAFGISSADGVITRMCDKYARYNNVSKNPTLDMVSESSIDTLKDLAAYSIILVCLLNEKESQ